MISLIVVPFIPTPEPMVRQMLNLAKLKPKEILYDLGAGDGRIITIAARDYGAIAFGIERNEERVKEAQKNIQGIVGASILAGNFYSIDLSNADVVTCYLNDPSMPLVGRKLSDELKQGARIVSHNYEIPGWHHITIEGCPNNLGHRLILYEVGKQQ